MHLQQAGEDNLLFRSERSVAPDGVGGLLLRGLDGVEPLLQLHNLRPQRLGLSLLRQSWHGGSSGQGQGQSAQSANASK